MKTDAEIIHCTKIDVGVHSYHRGRERQDLPRCGCYRGGQSGRKAYSGSKIVAAPCVRDLHHSSKCCFYRGAGMFFVRNWACAPAAIWIDIDLRFCGDSREMSCLPDQLYYPQMELYEEDMQILQKAIDELISTDGCASSENPHDTNNQSKFPATIEGTSVCSAYQCIYMHEAASEHALPASVMADGLADLSRLPPTCFDASVSQERKRLTSRKLLMV